MRNAPQNTIRLSDTDRGARAAAALLRQGRLAAFPTETVYGLGGDARDPTACAAIYAAKGRPSVNPLIAHVLDAAAAAELADLSDAALALAAAFWPGPLTLVAPRRMGCGLAAAVTAGLPTVAVRVPLHPTARRLLAAFGGPVAAPSANRSGAVSPTTADHVLEDLYGRIDAVIDGGATPVGLESTIISVTRDGPVLLREGAIPAAGIAQVVGPLTRAGDGDAAAPASPGRLLKHYAPRAAVRLNAAAPRPGEAWLGFGPDPAAAMATARETLSATGDLTEAAARLFAALRALDATGAAFIAVAPVPETGLGAAINDRLRRAAAR